MLLRKQGRDENAAVSTWKVTGWALLGKEGQDGTASRCSSSNIEDLPARSPARRRTADPAHDRQRGRVRRLRGAQWDRRGSSDHGRTRVHRGHSDHQRASRARRRPPSLYLKTVDPGQQTITFDLIQFFTGEAATKAAAEDGQESPPPNDYYIRNVNSRLRTLPVRSGAPITVNVLAAGSTGSSTKDVSVTLDELAGYFPNSGTAPFWITVEQGQVTKIAQQFLP